MLRKKIRARSMKSTTECASLQGYISTMAPLSQAHATGGGCAWHVYESSICCIAAAAKVYKSEFPTESDG